jgi:hypothetical protein
MFGQFGLEPVCGAAPPGLPEGAVAPGAVDGAGLAAETTATAPPTRSSAEMAPVRTMRRRPIGRDPTAAGSTDGGVAGTIGWKI